MRFAASLAWILLGAFAVANWQQDRALREEAFRFARKYRFDVRRPLILGEIAVAPAGDLAVESAVGGAIDDLLAPMPWGSLTFDERQLWLEAVTGFDAEMAEAEGLVLAPLRARPGWAYHRFQLGQVVYLADRRQLNAGKRRPPETWDVPLALAVQAAPEDDAIHAFRAGAWLEMWDTLPEPWKRKAPDLFRRAFLDADLVQRGIQAAVTVLGREEALSLLPEDARTLRRARDEMGKSGDTEAAARLHERWERAERAERTLEMEKLERREHQGDVDGLRIGCARFAARHSPRDIDSPAERRRFARLLQLWPADVAGQWRSDPRGNLVRFFLDGREDSVDPAALSRSISVLTNVPEVMRARAYLMASDRYAWEETLRRSESVGTLAWTPFFVDLARQSLEAGLVDSAAAALGKISNAARGECDVLLARRAVARAAGNRADEAGISAALAASRPGSYPATEWGDGQRLSLCVDPEADAGSALEVAVLPEGPALVTWGWDGADSSWRHISGPARLRVPLSGLSGRRTFSLRTLAGAEVAVVDAVVIGAPLAEASPAAQAPPRTAANVTGMAGNEKLKSTSP